LNAAFFLNARLLNRDHLGKLSGGLLVTSEERRRPKDHDSGGRRNGVIGALLS
jgi:hypothetical protein